jgi:hypothetical protein
MKLKDAQLNYLFTINGAPEKNKEIDQNYEIEKEVIEHNRLIIDKNFDEKFCIHPEKFFIELFLYKEDSIQNYLELKGWGTIFKNLSNRFFIEFDVLKTLLNDNKTEFSLNCNNTSLKLTSGLIQYKEYSIYDELIEKYITENIENDDKIKIKRHMPLKDLFATLTIVTFNYFKC